MIRRTPQCLEFVFVFYFVGFDRPTQKTQEKTKKKLKKLKKAHTTRPLLRTAPGDHHMIRRPSPMIAEVFLVFSGPKF